MVFIVSIIAVNFSGKVGAIGFSTRIAPFLFPVSLVKIDQETGLPLRDRNNMCIHCQPGELEMQSLDQYHSPICHILRCNSLYIHFPL